MTYLFLFMLLSVFTTESNGARCKKYRTITVNDTRAKIIEQNLLDGKNKFGLELLRVLHSQQQLNNTSAGIFFSPQSIWSSLFITYMGAQRTTKHEMRRVLGLGSLDKALLWKVYNDSENRSLGASYKSANRIFIQEGSILKKCLKELLKNDISFVNFNGKPEEARIIVNSYVEEKTENKIRDLLAPDIIDPLTRIVIVNAIYFKDLWKNAFDRKHTLPDKFFVEPDREINVSMMKIEKPFSYGSSQELQCTALELPYLGNSSMVILLPFDHINGMDKLVNDLTAMNFQDLIKNMTVEMVLVKLPVFKMQNTFELDSILQSMGLETLFNPDQVDLSGFTERKEPLEIKVVHKAFMEVNEGGTEASAATALIVKGKKTRRINEFVVNRPFIFFIRNRLRNSIYFVGIVQRPLEV